MADKTGIEWVNYHLHNRIIEGHTYNRWWGCVAKDASCRHCYAEALSKRYGRAQWGHSTDRQVVGQAALNAPSKWQKKAEKAGEVRLVFCGSMKDILEPRTDLNSERAAIWDMIDQTPNLIWLLLTKRPEQFEYLLPQRWLEPGGWPDNVWPGISAGTQAGLDVRWPFLAALPAPVVFTSLEPIIEPMSFREISWRPVSDVQRLLRAEYTAEEALHHAERYRATIEARGGVARLHRRELGKQAWIITGGESGPQARPAHPRWFRAIRDEVQDSTQFFLHKQNGEYIWRSEVADWNGERWVRKPEWADSIARATQRDQWGLIDFDGTYSRGTTTWNMREDDQQDNYEVTVYRVGKKAAGRTLDGQVYHAHPDALYSYIRQFAE